MTRPGSQSDFGTAPQPTAHVLYGSIPISSAFHQKKQLAPSATLPAPRPWPLRRGTTLHPSAPPLTPPEAGRRVLTKQTCKVGAGSARRRCRDWPWRSGPMSVRPSSQTFMWPAGERGARWDPTTAITAMAPAVLVAHRYSILSPMIQIHMLRHPSPSRLGRHQVFGNYLFPSSFKYGLD